MNIHSQIKTWTTINDPYTATYHGYGTGREAPGIYGPGDKVYQAAHNMILAHACAYHAYKDIYPSGIYRVFISQNPEKLLKTIQLHKISVGVINDLKKKAVSERIKL